MARGVCILCTSPTYGCFTAHYCFRRGCHPSCSRYVWRRMVLGFGRYWSPVQTNVLFCFVLGEGANKPSVAAVVASYNISFTQYSARVRAQGHREEIMVNSRCQQPIPLSTFHVPCFVFWTIFRSVRIFFEKKSSFFEKKNRLFWFVFFKLSFFVFFHWNIARGKKGFFWVSFGCISHVVHVGLGSAADWLFFFEEMGNVWTFVVCLSG